MITVVSFLWRDPAYRYGTIYGAEHVNRLRSMLARHLHQPHQLTCFTDDASGIDPAVRVLPLWPDHRDMGGTWTRVKLFSAEMAEMIGPRFVLMDLDVVIVDAIDQLFETDADLKTTRSTSSGSFYNTAFFLLKAGSRRQVWDSFDPDTARRVVTVDGHWEQAWASYVLGKGEATWGASDGVLQYGTDVLRGNGGRLPNGARIVFFPGPHDPSKPETQAKSPWIVEHWV